MLYIKNLYYNCVRGFSFGLKVLAAVFYFCIWTLLRRQHCDDINLTSACQQVGLLCGVHHCSHQTVGSGCLLFVFKNAVCAIHL
jgi:hypothetical protein